MAKAKKDPAAPKKATALRAAKAPKASRASKVKPRGLEKKFLKNRPACKVTFTLPKEAAAGAETVCVMGEFNSWSPDSHPLKKQKTGDFTATVELETGRSYRFRYIVDGWKYENDWLADRYEANPYGGDDSVVDL